MSSSRDKGKDKAPPSHVQLWHATDKKHGKKPHYLRKSEKAEQPIGQAASDAAKNAKGAAKAALPFITAAGISMLSDTGGYISLAPLGVPMTVGGIVLDAIKAPFCLVVATEEAVRAGITKVVSLIFEKSPAQMVIDSIFNSFLIRMRETASLLVALGLEDRDVLNRKLKSGDIEDLVGLTLLHTAYASRNYYGGLMLANGKTLVREDCPVEGRALFDKVMTLKESINAVFKANSKLERLSTDERQLEESRVVCEWIRLIKAGQPVGQSDKSGATMPQIMIVNNIIEQIEDLKRSGMSVLPKEPAAVFAREMPRPR